MQEVLLFWRMFILFCLFHVSLFTERQQFDVFLCVDRLAILVAHNECLLFECLSFFLQTKHDRIQSKIPDDVLVLSVSWLPSTKDKSCSFSINQYLKFIDSTLFISVFLKPEKSAKGKSRWKRVYLTLSWASYLRSPLDRYYMCLLSRPFSRKCYPYN